MNKQTEDGILDLLFHVHEKSIGAHPLDPQPNGVQWWIRRCCGARSLKLQISYMGIDAYSAEDFWMKSPQTFVSLLFLLEEHSDSWVCLSPLRSKVVL